MSDTNSVKNLVLFIEDDDVYEMFYDSITTYSEKTWLEIDLIRKKRVEDAITVVVEQVLESQQDVNPLLIWLDGNLIDLHWVAFIERILEFSKKTEYKDIALKLLEVTYWFTADTSYFKEMLDRKWITEEQFPRSRIHYKSLNLSLFKILNKKTWYSVEDEY